MSLFAIDAEDRAGQLIRLTEQLTDRLAHETQAYEAHKAHEVAAGVAETARLANLYRHEAVRVKLQPQLIAGARPETRDRLKRTTEAFERVLARHGRAVNAARQISEGLVRAIAEEISRQRGAVASYGPKARQLLRPATSLTLNRRA